MNFFKDIIKELSRKKYSGEDIQKLKIKLCRKYKINKIPSNVEILLSANLKALKKISLVTKPIRTISGIAVIALMTKPIKCPKDEPCIYCPGGLGSVFGNVPQSYTGKEPASMRGIRNKFDPYFQIFNRLEQYILNDHCPEKVELIIMGGTFPSFKKSYQNYFVKYAFKALNDFSKMFYKNGDFDFIKFKKFFELPGEINDIKRTEKIHEKLRTLKIKTSLEEEQKKNEKVKIRCVAICQETRPDFSMEKEIDQMLKLGVTRVELGVQHLKNKVLKKINRGHLVEDSIKATRLLKDSFLKVGYHMMPGLYGSSIKEDKEMLEELFKNSDFRPDALKIYPCMVFKGTKLYDLWKKGKYKPLNTEKAAKLIAEFKEKIPLYCRVLRIQRDIPSYQNVAGVDVTNFRQLIHEKYKPKCRCIRCREPGNKKIDWNKVKILRKDYEASNGTEIFISAEDVKNDLLLGFCRLRIPYKSFRKEIGKNSAGIRELHVYGILTPLRKKGKIQHKGLGRNLLLRAEKIAKEEFGVKKLLIISGVGVKEYYKKFGYKKDNAYMSKKL